MPNPYHEPAELDLEMVGDIEWTDEAYQFDITAVWRHRTTGLLYMADDSGCSCPSPFEDHHSVDTLTQATKSQIIRHLRDRSAVKAASLIDRVRALPLPTS